MKIYRLVMLGLMVPAMVLTCAEVITSNAPPFAVMWTIVFFIVLVLFLLDRTLRDEW